MRIKCKECPFYERKNHGHGENYPECGLLLLLSKIQKPIIEQKSKQYTYVKDPYKTLPVNDNDDCKFLDFELF